MKGVPICSYLMLDVDKACVGAKRIESVVESEPGLDGEEIVSVFEIKVLEVFRSCRLKQEWRVS